MQPTKNVTAPTPRAACAPARFTPGSLAKVTEEVEFRVADEESVARILQRWRVHPARPRTVLATNGEEGGRQKQWVLVLDINIPARLQTAPSCGLVCLRLAAEENRISLLPIAKDQGITDEGEMFSASALAQLADKYYNAIAAQNEDAQCLKVECKNTNWTTEEVLDILHHIYHRGLILVPYDADKNHEPTTSGGQHAHWAILRGFVWSLPLGFNLTNEQQVEDDSGMHPFLEKNWGHMWEKSEDLSSDTLETRCYIRQAKNARYNECDSCDFKLLRYVAEYSSNTSGHPFSGLLFVASQPKSKFPSLWRLDALINSNLGLQAYDYSKYTPFDGSPRKRNDIVDLSELRGKVVCLSTTNENSK